MIVELDKIIFYWLNSFVGKSIFIDSIIVFSASYLIYIAVLFLICISLLPLFKNYIKQNFELFISAMLSAFISRFVFTEIIRFFYNRPRPFASEMIDNINQFISHPSNFAFPSGHASFVFALAMSVSYVYPKLGILFFLIALLIGIGRIAAGLHFPTDIFAGAIIGILTSILINSAVRKYKK